MDLLQPCLAIFDETAAPLSRTELIFFKERNLPVAAARLHRFSAFTRQDLDYRQSLHPCSCPGARE